MRRKTKKRSIGYVSYVCDPRDIIIEATRPIDSQHLTVELKVSGKVALVGRYTVGFIDDIDTIHEKVKKFCEAVNKFTDKEIQHHLIAERIIPALSAKQTLKEVRAKTGRLIWSR
tara:strand:+ start:466 stop:810 length:345 start_codon:yes stop_codon:yes gene_type:complete